MINTINLNVSVDLKDIKLKIENVNNKLEELEKAIEELNDAKIIFSYLKTQED